MQRSAAVPFSERTETKVGSAVERCLGGWLMSRGGRVLPSYDYSGLADDKAPRLAALVPDESLVVPDLLHASRGRTCWIECKFKTHADWTHKTQRYETGISIRLWRHYQKVRETTGLPVWLVFAHWKEGEVRGLELADLAALPPRFYEGRKMGWSGMVFFPWDSLRTLATTEEVGLDAVLKPFGYER